MRSCSGCESHVCAQSITRCLTFLCMSCRTRDAPSHSLRPFLSILAAVAHSTLSRQTMNIVGSPAGPRSISRLQATALLAASRRSHRSSSTLWATVGKSNSSRRSSRRHSSSTLQGTASSISNPRATAAASIRRRRAAWPPCSLMGRAPSTLLMLPPCCRCDA